MDAFPPKRAAPTRTEKAHRFFGLCQHSEWFDIVVRLIKNTGAGSTECRFRSACQNLELAEEYQGEQ